MWWLATEMTDDGNRLLSRGEELQLGCPAPGSVTGALSRGAKARIEGPPANGLRSAQEGLLVVARKKLPFLTVQSKKI